MGSLLGLGRSSGEGNGNPLQFLPWEILWTEKPGGLQSMGSQRDLANKQQFLGYIRGKKKRDNTLERRANLPG